MEFILDFENMPDYVLIRTNGPAAVKNFESLLKDLTGSPEWVKGTPQIVDHRELDLTVIVPNETREVWGIIKDYSGKLGDGPCAFVVGDELGFGFVRMYELLGGDSIHNRIEVFYSFKDALYWIKSLK